MLPFALKVLAETVDVGPSLTDLARLVVAFAPEMGLCVVFGAIVAVLFRRHIAFQVLSSVVVGFAVHAVLIWRSHDPDLWSWHDPITSEIYQFAPTVLFCVVPALAGVLIVIGLQLWRHAKSI